MRGCPPALASQRGPPRTTPRPGQLGRLARPARLCRSGVGLTRAARWSGADHPRCPPGVLTTAGLLPIPLLRLGHFQPGGLRNLFSVRLPPASCVDAATPSRVLFDVARCSALSYPSPVPLRTCGIGPSGDRARPHGGAGFDTRISALCRPGGSNPHALAGTGFWDRRVCQIPPSRPDPRRATRTCPPGVGWLVGWLVCYARRDGARRVLLARTL
jgi:hypothetical protein